MPIDTVLRQCLTLLDDPFAIVRQKLVIVVKEEDGPASCMSDPKVPCLRWAVWTWVNNYSQAFFHNPFKGLLCAGRAVIVYN
jgi:hypothetical protein